MELSALVRMVDPKISADLTNSIAELLRESVRRSYKATLPDAANSLVAGFIVRIARELMAKGYHSERLGDYTYIRSASNVVDLFDDFDRAIMPFLTNKVEDFGFGMATGDDNVPGTCC